MFISDFAFKKCQCEIYRAIVRYFYAKQNAILMSLKIINDIV